MLAAVSVSIKTPLLNEVKVVPDLLNNTCLGVLAVLIVWPTVRLPPTHVWTPLPEFALEPLLPIEPKPKPLVSPPWEPLFVYQISQV